MSSSSSPTSSQVGATGGGVVRRRRSGRRRRPRSSATDYNINLPYDHHQQLLQQEEFIQAAAAAAAAGASSSSTGGHDIWPEPFVEALVLQVAVDARSSIGRLAVAPAIALLFQVCSTWRAVSRSEYLWQILTGHIWNRRHRNPDHRWRDEYIYWHRTARNFHIRRYDYTTLRFDDDAAPDVVDEGVAAAGGAAVNLFCLRLTLSDHYLAAGFSDGSVRLFNLHPRVHLHTFRPLPRDRLGVFSQAITGVIVLSEQQVVFGCLDGDIHVSAIDGGGTHRAYLGDVVNDGTLVDFTGCERYWVGLYAGVPGRAIHIWDGTSEELLFVGGTLTDQEAVIGWHTLTDLTAEATVGRVRITGWERAVACTAVRSLTFDLHHQGVVLADLEPHYGIIVGTFDSVGGGDDNLGQSTYVVVDRRGVATVRRASTMEEVCSFSVVRGGGSQAAARGLLGAMNVGCVVICAAVSGVVRVWDAEHGELLYSLRERVAGVVTYIAVSDRHVAAVGGDPSVIQLWDFGA